MRFLFLTNFYPPASRGGYEQWCQEVAEGLRTRGHDVFVLTSTYGRKHLLETVPWIERKLHLEMEFASLRNAYQFFANRKQREVENLSFLRDAFEQHKPDAILLWGMWNLHRSLPALAEELMPGKVVYYMGDYWATLPSQFENYWNISAQNFVTGLPKLILRPIALQILNREERPALQLEHALFPTAFLRDELERKGISPKNTKIIYGGIDTSLYLNHHDGAKPAEITSLLYIGRLTNEKGVHTAIKAVAHLVNEYYLKELKLTIVGDGNADYVNYLQRLVEQEKIASFVTFTPAQPKETLPALYHQSDIFLFTSIWAEPFGRVIVEAMASGVTVVGTAVGGASEILVENENALVFAPDDPKSLSHQLKKLIESPLLREKLAKAGCQTAKNNFDIQRMTAEIESYLQTLAN
jgi:glycosyltransferase involved in cell wall biosynthesis